MIDYIQPEIYLLKCDFVAVYQRSLDINSLVDEINLSEPTSQKKFCKMNSAHFRRAVRYFWNAVVRM